MASLRTDAAAQSVHRGPLLMRSAVARLRAWAALGDAAHHRRRQAVLELTLALSLIELVLWPLSDSPARVPLCGALAAVCAFSVWRRWERLEESLSSRKSVLSAWTITSLVTLALGILVVVFGWSLGILRSDELLRMPVRTVGDWLGVKLPTVAVQQLLLQWFFLPLMLDIVVGSERRSIARRGLAVLLCGTLFAMVHLPNLLLVLLTLGAGTIWCTLYLNHKRVAPLIVSHLVLAVLAANVGHVYVLNMSVGSRCVPLLPRWVQLADGRTMCTMPAVVSGHIDACQPRGSQMMLQGWIVDRRKSQSLDQLTVCVNGQLHEVPISDTRVARPDVARVFNDAQIADCGFCIYLPRRWFATENQVRLFGKSTAGIFSELNYGKHYAWAAPAK